MTLTRERVEKLRADAEAAASELVVGVEGDVLGALLDAWEELERIKADVAEVQQSAEEIRGTRLLTTADEDRIVARALKEWVKVAHRESNPYLDDMLTPVWDRADQLEGGE